MSVIYKLSLVKRDIDRIPDLNDLAMSSSVNPANPNDFPTSMYCWATGFLGVNRVPKASKQIRRFRFDIVTGSL